MQRESWDEIYRRYADVCFSVALYVLRAPDEAEDCVHDVFLRIWNAPGAYREERGSMRAFLIACVRNEALTRRRNAARRSAIEQREAGREPAVVELDVHDHVESARLRRALDGLPDEQRRALELAYFGGLTHVEIAAALGEPLGTIKSRLALGLRRLGRELRPPQGVMS
ncbi:MAG: sigma-70 family RNA polymerase sigma factor [Candidatus Eremiobacteraeota bacterium]|nr:sigma-70 family RNA polymerase sigma factor [Candidatus Eremiobacteraeota bacterium]